MTIYLHHVSHILLPLFLKLIYTVLCSD
uniref:Uncharacterized protein n=1 Tax=Arundo donax TaxID=35708 RepID=A0A0A8Y2X4_ARUDO